MTLNAMPAIAHKPLESEGIDPRGIEEVRIIQILRASPAAKSGDVSVAVWCQWQGKGVVK